MKKLIVSIFAVFYLGMSCGFSMDIHFCMGKISSVSFFENTKNACDKCGMKKSRSCCDSTSTFVKISDNQQPSFVQVHFTVPVCFIQNNFAAYTVKKELKQTVTSHTNISPPAVSGSFRCILHSIFII